MADDIPTLQPTEPPEVRTSRKAIFCLIFGVMSVSCLPLLAAFPGALLGILAAIDISGSRGRLKGQGLTVAGLILCGFSFVVTPILGIMLGILLPAVQRVRMAANRVRAQNNLKQVALAFHNHESATRRLPAGIPGPDGMPILSWRVAILPYIDPMLNARADLTQPWDAPANAALRTTMPPTYQDPFTRAATDTPYRIFIGPGTLYPDLGTKPKYSLMNIPRGTSNTILAVEAADAVPWSKPQELTSTPGFNRAKLGNPSNKFFIVAMMDGSVRAIDRSVSERTLQSAIDPDDLTPLGPDW